jgi:hypothetical protein
MDVKRRFSDRFGDDLVELADATADADGGAT